MIINHAGPWLKPIHKLNKISDASFFFFQEPVQWVPGQPGPFQLNGPSSMKVFRVRPHSQTRLPRLPHLPNLPSVWTESRCNDKDSVTCIEKICFHFRLRRRAHTISGLYFFLITCLLPEFFPALGLFDMVMCLHTWCSPALLCSFMAGSDLGLVSRWGWGLCQLGSSSQIRTRCGLWWWWYHINDKVPLGTLYFLVNLCIHLGEIFHIFHHIQTGCSFWAGHFL